MNTTGDLDTRDGAAAAEFVDRMLKWDDTMLDIPINKLKKTLANPKCNGIIFLEHSWRQLKLSMSWYEEQCRLVDYSEEKIMREIELKRIHGSSLSPFKRKDIMYLIAHQKNPIDKVDVSNNLCPFNIYQKLKPNTPYILCVDPAEGLDTDNNAVTLINPYTQLPVMEFRSPYVSQPELGRMLIKFMDQYCPRSMIVIENNRGRELINFFMDSKYRFNLYYDDSKLLTNISEKVDKYGAIVQSAYERRAYGLSTTRSNRPKYYAILENVVEERKDLLYTEFLVDDVCGLIRKANGRVEAGPGKHDDNIMSYLMGLYIYYNAPFEVLERYGIVRGASEEELYDDNGNMTEQEMLRRMKEMVTENALPPELQALIQDTLNQKNDIDDSWQYYKEVDAAMHEQPRLPSQMNPGELNRGFVQSASPIDDSFWARYDEEIMQSNWSDRDTFNIEDYLD